MLLNEIINTRSNTINYDTFSNKSYFEVHSVIDDVPYVFIARQMMNLTDRHLYWTIAFGVNTFEYRDGYDCFDMEFDIDIVPTGKGNSVKIMTWVEHCFDLFVQQYDDSVQRITFSANINERSRVRLYDRFIPVLKKKGWILQDKRIGPGFVEYMYERIK